MAPHRIDRNSRNEKTLPYVPPFGHCEERRQREGRSLSKLAAFLIEQALEVRQPVP
jgi:hypothetical protein